MRINYQPQLVFRRISESPERRPWSFVLHLLPPSNTSKAWRKMWPVLVAHTFCCLVAHGWFRRMNRCCNVQSNISIRINIHIIFTEIPLLWTDISEAIARLEHEQNRTGGLYLGFSKQRGCCDMLLNQQAVDGFHVSSSDTIVRPFFCIFYCHIFMQGWAIHSSQV